MNFKELKPDDYSFLAPYFDHQKYDLCVYSLPSLISWNTAVATPYFAVDDTKLVIKQLFPRRPELDHLILPLSTNGTPSPGFLRELAEKSDLPCYWFIPEGYVKEHGIEAISEFFDVEEQTAYEDYVYNASDLSELAGSRYSKKRNLIKQFIRSHVDAGKVEITRMTPDDADACLTFLEEWCLERNCNENPEESLACEKEAAKRAIRNMDTFRMRGLVLRIDGKVSAFGMSGRLNSGMGVLHFEKAFSSVKGLYQYFDRECARTLFPGLTYINKESDMDMPGLAKAKKSYYPAFRVKSYLLRLKNA